MAEAIETGEQSIVGVNIFSRRGRIRKSDIFQQAPDMQAKRIEYVRQYKKNRNQEPVRKALDFLYDTVRHRPEAVLMEPVTEAQSLPGQHSGNVRRHAGQHRF